VINVSEAENKTGKLQAPTTVFKGENTPTPTYRPPTPPPKTSKKD
jgi:hypothetical protein